MAKINENYQAAENSIKEITESYIENLQAAQELGQEFMYQVLMDYGNQLGEFPEEKKIEENKIHGCQSTVFISCEKIADKIFFQGYADSRLVQGQVAILLKIFDGRTSGEIINGSKEHLDNFVEKTNIIARLTPSRQNAFGSMYYQILNLAQNLK